MSAMSSRGPPTLDYLKQLNCACMLYTGGMCQAVCAQLLDTAFAVLPADNLRVQFTDQCSLRLEAREHSSHRSKPSEPPALRAGPVIAGMQVTRPDFAPCS